MIAEDVDVVAELAEGGGGGGAGQTGADHDDAELAPVGRIDQLGLEAMVVPLLGDGAAGDPGVEFHVSTSG